MAQFNGRSYTNHRGINLQESNGVLRFETPLQTPTTTSGERLLYVDSSNQLIYDSGSATTIVGAAGGSGAIPAWETIFGQDSTFTITPDVTFTIAGNRSTATNVVTLTNIAGGSGAILQLTNATTSNKDINGTSSTWSVLGTGVGTFAGLSISGTSTALVTTGAAVWTLKDNDAAALSIGATGSTSMLVFDTTDNAETVKTSATVFQVTSGKANFIQASNTVSTAVFTDNTITTFGANANSAGLVVIRSTSLTTGALLQLQVTEGTLNGGFFIVGRHVTAGSNVYTVGEAGATVIAGVGGSDMLTVSAGDLVVSDGSLTITDADNAATVSVTNDTATTAAVYKFVGSGTFTGTGSSSFFNVTASGLTTGTALTVIANTATTSVGVVDVSVTGLTTGSALRITSSTANFTTGAKMIELAMVAATAGNGLTVTTTGAYTGTGMINVSTGAATTGVLLQLTSTTGLTSGSLIRATTSTAGAIATNGAISFTGTGNFTNGSATLGFVNVTCASTVAGTIMNVTGGALTTGVALSIDDSGTGITSGSLLRIATGTTGAVATNGVVSIRATGAFTSTSNVGLVDILASAVTGAGTVMRIKSSAASQTAVEVLRVEAAGYTTGYSGVVMNVVGVATTGAAASTHSVLTITGANTTGGNMLQLSNNALTTGVGMLFAHTTSVIADGGSMVRLSSSSVDTGGSTNGTILDIGNTGSTAAIVVKITDTTTTTGNIFGIRHTTGVIANGGSLLRLTSTSVDTSTTTGVLLDLAATAATTGHLAIITSATLTTGSGMLMTLNGLTTGAGLNITSSSTDTGTRGLVKLTQSGSGATGTSMVLMSQVVTSTNFRKIFTESNTGITLWWGNGTTANGALAATTGDVLLNGGSNKPEYCTNGAGSVWAALV